MAETNTTETTTDDSLYSLLLQDLALELSSEDSYSADKLSLKIKQAIREVRAARKYPSHYSDDDIDEDLENFYATIRNIALYDYNQIGVEFQSSHNENETDRNWIERDKLFYGVYPFGKC